VGIGSVRLIREVNGQKYYMPQMFRPGTYTVLRGLRDDKFNLYIFEKDVGNPLHSDFALLRLKNAEKYGFDASERYDMWIGGDVGSLHAWVEVPKDFEVVGVMPEIGKRMITVPTTGEKIPMYYRGYYIGLKNRITGERNIFLVSVAEGKYGISVVFALAKEGENK